jgi:uncharacterized protein YdaL
LLVALALALAQPVAAYATAPTPETSPARTLVLYDTSGDFGHLGDLYAQMVGNLSSRFGGWTAAPVAQYRDGDMADHDLVIYIGNSDSEVLPTAFLDDVLAAENQVLWLGLNLDELHNRTLPFTNNYFANLYGWQYRALDDSPVDSVLYKGQALTRESRGASPIMDIVSADPAKYEVLAEAVRTSSDTRFPWAVRSPGMKFTYVGEVPLSYITETDRYLILADLLFDDLAPDTQQRHRGLVRIEDVSPLTKPDQLRRIADILHAKQVPFSVAVIPVHVAPPASEVRLSDRPELVAALRYMVDKGGTLLQHGTTHQYGTEPNPYPSAATGDDFEFFKAHVDANDYVILDGPVPDDSPQWARERMAWGAEEFRKAGLPAPAVFEFPHYAASEAAYRVAHERYVARYERGLYFHERPGSSGIDYSSHFGQFFPYEVTDVHGSRIIPENLGNVVDVGYNNHPAVTPQDIIDRAEKNLVVRDGFASFFFHPFLEQPERLGEIIDGIQSKGYTFVSSSDVLNQFPTGTLDAPSAPTDLLAVQRGDTLTATFTEPKDPEGAPINGYEYSLDGQQTWTSVPRADVGNLQMSIGENATEMALRAINAAGRGPAATAPVLTPLPAPSDLSATRGDRQAQLTWTDPGDGGNPIQQYEYSLDEGPWVDLGTLSSPATISGLSNGTTHEIRLRAVNIAGPGDPAGPAQVTPATVPDAPQQVSVDTAFRSATVSWESPNDGGDPITGYVVHAEPGGLQCTASSATSCEIRDLQDSQTYVFTVTASNGIGDSPAASSQPVTMGTDIATAVLVSSSDHVVAGSSVTFDASASTTLSGTITTYEWNVDGAGFRPGGATLRHNPVALGNSSVEVRVTGEGGTSSTAAATVRVLPKSLLSPGVAINNGAEFSTSRDVPVTLGWPDGSEEAFISADSSFSNAERVALQQDLAWRLGDAPGRQTLYVRFRGPGVDQVITDDIVFDPQRPTVKRVKAQAMRVTTKKVRSYRITTRATDPLSGVRALRVNTKKSVKGAVTSPYRKQTRVHLKPGKRVYVQVQDGAGNWSAWTRVTIVKAPRSVSRG